MARPVFATLLQIREKPFNTEERRYERVAISTRSSSEIPNPGGFCRVRDPYQLQKRFLGAVSRIYGSLTPAGKPGIRDFRKKTDALSADYLSSPLTPFLRVEGFSVLRAEVCPIRYDSYRITGPLRRSGVTSRAPQA